MSHPVRHILKLLLLVSALAVFTTVASAQTLPVVNGDAYSLNVNGNINVAAGSGVLVNDTGFNPASYRIESYDTISQFNGLVMLAADGSFTYDPAPGFKGVDSFTYTVRNPFGTAHGVVTLDVGGDVVWFVDDTAPAGGDGTFNAPFNSLTNVNGGSGVGDVDSINHTIFVYEGNYSIEFDLEAGQKLIGHSEGLDLVGTQNDVAAGTAPVLTNTGTFPIVELFSVGGTVRGFVINNTNSYAIQGAAVSNITLANIDINATVNATGAILLNGVSGTNSVNDVDITGTLPATNSALVLLNNSGLIDFSDSSVSSFTGGYVLNVNANSGTITFISSDLSSTNTRGLTIQSQTATGRVTLAGVNLDGGAAGEPLVRLQGNNANSTVNFEQGVLADATTADSIAFQYDGGKLKIAGTNSALTSADGAALYLENVELTQNATFTTLSSTSSNARGISIDNPVGAFDIIVTGTTTISTPTTQAINIDDTLTPSGFALTLNTLNSTGGTFGIRVLAAAITVSDTASTLTTSAGMALYCEDSVANLAFATLTSAGGTSGLFYDTCSGTTTAAGGSLTSTAGASNDVVRINTSTVNLSYNGTISKNNAGLAVAIDGLSNPGLATFNGMVTASNASGGVSLMNSSRNITFTTLNLGTAGARFTTTPIALAGNTGRVILGNVAIYTNNATGLNIAYANASPGEVSSSAGSLINVLGNATALNVTHATAQDLNLTFASIISTGAGTHGINLNRTTGVVQVEVLADFGAKTTAGVEISNSNITVYIQELDINGAFDGVKLTNNSTAGLNVNEFVIMGDLNFVSMHTNGMGGTFTNIVDNAFDITNATTTRVTDLIINGTGSHGVTGTGVNGTTIFSNVDMTNIGNADNEHVFNFQEGATSGAQVSGSLDINNSIIQNFTDNGLYLENFTGTLDFRWTNVDLRNNITTTACGGGNCNGNGIFLRADGTSRINAFIQNGVFEDIDGVGITANPEGNSGARMDILVSSSSFTAEPYGGTSHTNNGEIAISLRNAQGNSTLNFRLFSNDIRNYTGELAFGVVEVEGGDFTTTNGVIETLYIYHAHEGNALQIFADGQNTSNPAITTNLTMNVSMNDVNVPAGTPINGPSIQLQNNGAISGSTVNANYIITNSRLLVNATGTSRRTVTVNVRDFNNACMDIRSNTIAAGTGGTQPSVNLSYNGSGNVRLQGMSGAGDTNAIAYLGANNILSVAAISGPNNNVQSAVCTTPTLPGTFPFN